MIYMQYKGCLNAPVALNLYIECQQMDKIGYATDKM
jgi:hypothetical protein